MIFASTQDFSSQQQFIFRYIFFLIKLVPNICNRIMVMPSSPEGCSVDSCLFKFTIDLLLLVTPAEFLTNFIERYASNFERNVLCSFHVLLVTSFCFTRTYFFIMHCILVYEVLHCNLQQYVSVDRWLGGRVRRINTGIQKQ